MYRSYIGLLIAAVSVNTIAGPGIFVSSSNASLPENLDDTFQEISGLSGAEWGLGVIEFKTGEEKTYETDRQFQMGIPHLPLTAFAIVLSNEGVIPLDGLIARGEFFWERLHWAQQGGRGMCMAVIWSIGEGRINEWIDTNGYTGTEIKGVYQDYPNCPAYDPNYITVNDALRYLQTFYDNLDQSSVRRIATNPPLSDHIRETLGFDNTIYGWLDISEDSKLLFMIIDQSVESDLGIVMLAEDMNNTDDLDQGFRMLYEALID
jgi:hypothetical protein